MNDKFKVWLAMATGIVGLLAAIGDDVLPLLQAFPLLASAWASGLPLGLWSVFGALVVSMAVWGFLIHWLPNLHDGSRPQFAAAVGAIAIGISVTLTQVIGQSVSVKLNAVWMGLAAGCLAPVMANGLRSLFVKAGAPPK